MEQYKNVEKDSIKFQDFKELEDINDIGVAFIDEMSHIFNTPNFIFNNHGLLMQLYLKLRQLYLSPGHNQEFFLTILDNLIFLFLNSDRISIDCYILLSRVLIDLIKKVDFNPSEQFLVGVFQETLFPTKEILDENKNKNYTLRMNELMQFIIDKYCELIPYQTVIESFCEKAKDTTQFNYIRTLNRLIKNPNVTIQMILPIYDILPRIFEPNNFLFCNDFAELSATVVQKGAEFAENFLEKIDLSRLFNLLVQKPYRIDDPSCSIMKIFLVYLTQPSLFPNIIQYIDHKQLFELLIYCLNNPEEFLGAALTPFIQKSCILYKTIIQNYPEAHEIINQPFIDLFFSLSEMNFQMKIEAIKVLCCTIHVGNPDLIQYAIANDLIIKIFESTSSLEDTDDLALFLETIKYIIDFAHKSNDENILQLIYDEDNLQILNDLVEDCQNPDFISQLKSILDQNPYNNE